ncbi:alpha/beta fold hydrolase [Roseibium sp. RKSG952]|uniref:alpha/beta fold hydrolase n=1 Tax=Roseibium sp. RKSG952 TaxID=2529384 RepID=UPI0012BCDFFF|nr:alpha/beta hydrolase [Roseibium sp. RKSG952]MTH96863.1 alpha/beta hydrolase [Roseibium sp. RKSG952]
MERKITTTRDGVSLSFLTGGRGRDLLMLGGWSQAATLFTGQFEAFAQSHRIVALDNRGHGESAKPGDGYRIQRLAKDLFDVIVYLGLHDFDLVAHSLSVSMTWAYLDMFGPERPPRRLVLIDEPAALLARPDWPDTEAAQAGAVIPSLEAMSGLLEAVRNTRTVDDHLAIVGGMFSERINIADRTALATENLKLPREYAARLIENNVLQDWRPLLPNIHQTSLIFAGEASIHPLESQAYVAKSMPNAQLEVIPAAMGGSHFLMYENPDLFNRKALAFLNG